jgi:serine protease
MKRLAIFVFLLTSPALAFADPARHSVLVATAHRSHLSVRSMAVGGVDPSSSGHNYTEFSIVNGFAADLTDDEIASLKKSSEVLFIEDDKERHALGLQPRVDSSDLAQVTPYGINLVHAPQAWVGGRGTSINVAVLDTGIDYNHADLKDRYAGGYNTFTKTNDAMDDNGHGTHCSGIVGASDNAIGVVGVAPQVTLWGIKVLDKNGSGKSSNVIAGLNKVLDLKAQNGGNWIVSLSLGSCSPSSIEQQGFTAATAAGVLIAAAAGNHDPSSPDQCSSDVTNSYSVNFPAAYPGVIAVAAVDSTKQVADFSNTGPEVSLAAPGVDVLSTFPSGTGYYSVVLGRSGIVAPPVAGSPQKDVTASYVFCNLGKLGDFPASVAGKIALIKRGDITFHDKAKNAKAAGAVAVVIFNKDTSPITWTLIGRVDSTGQSNPGCNDSTSPVFSQCKDDPADVAFDWPLTVGITLADGQALQNDSSPVSLTVRYHTNDDYAVESGTSMACPHVAGTAAVVWSMAPTATATQVAQILISTAHDLGTAGPDPQYGNGLVDAEAAGKQIAPQLFGSGGTPTPTPPTGRKPGRRGH